MSRRSPRRPSTPHKIASAIVPPLEDVRQAIAHAAARLIAEGLTDYQSAKQKAARQLGASRHDTLPDNNEIETALREYHALFASDAQSAALAALHEAALRAMQWLDHFSPWISGAVLTGVANEYSAIELELIEVEAKTFEMFLLNEDVVFELHDARRSRPSTRRADAQRDDVSDQLRYDITFDDAPVEITLFDSHAQRLAVYPKSSIRHDRAQLAEATGRFVQK